MNERSASDRKLVVITPGGKRNEPREETNIALITSRLIGNSNISTTERGKLAYELAILLGIEFFKKRNLN
ncbi:MAG: hypothetical protein Q7R74_01620 [bacterium]|nr:hypothetical protein [bacterium]